MVSMSGYTTKLMVGKEKTMNSHIRGGDIMFKEHIFLLAFFYYALKGLFRLAFIVNEKFKFPKAG